MYIELAFKEVLNEVHKDILKALGWKKDGSNFRYYGEDGLCKIINFQKSRWNSNAECEFYINMGIYIEKADVLGNRTFKEYECQLRKRTITDGGSYKIFRDSDISLIKSRICEIVSEEVMEYMNTFSSKERFIEILLSDAAKQYSNQPIMHYGTCKLLIDMGYAKEVLPIIKMKQGEYFEKLANEVELLLKEDTKYC